MSPCLTPGTVRAKMREASLPSLRLGVSAGVLPSINRIIPQRGDFLSLPISEFLPRLAAFGGYFPPIGAPSGGCGVSVTMPTFPVSRWKRSFAERVSMPSGDSAIMGIS